MSIIERLKELMANVDSEQSGQACDDLGDAAIETLPALIAAVQALEDLLAETGWDTPQTPCRNRARAALEALK